MPTFWERQDGAVAGQYEVAGMQGSQMGGSSYHHHKFGRSEKSDAETPDRVYPVTLGGWSFGFVATERPERKILPYEKRYAISDADLWSDHLGTPKQAGYVKT